MTLELYLSTVFFEAKIECRKMHSLGGSGKFQGESRTSPVARRMLGNQHQPGIDQGGTQLF